MNKYQAIVGIVLLVTACGPPKEADQVVAISKEVDKVVGIARIEPERGLLDLSASNSGMISQIMVYENEEVKKGQVIASIDHSSELLEVKQAQSKIGTQQAVVQTNLSSVKSAKISLEKQRKSFQKNEQLLAIKAITPQSFDESKDDLEKLESSLEEALNKVEEGKKKLVELQTDLAFYANKVALKQITAPYDGKILSLDIHVGDNVSTGSKIGEFAPSGNLIAVTEVDELFADRLAIGQKAAIISQANNTEIGTGKVYFIADYLKKKSLFDDENSTEDRRVRTVKVWLESSSKVMINSRVDCIIFFK